MVRLTYTPPRWHERPSSLGILLEDARSWSRDEIDLLKGRRTVRQELEENQRPVKRDISKRGLGELASAKLQGMRLLGASQSYVDNLEKLFFNSIPENLLCKPIKAVSARKLAGALKQLDDKPGQARTLRAMMGQILKSAAEFEPSAWRLLGLTQKLYTPDYEGRRQRKSIGGIRKDFLRNCLADWNLRNTIASKPISFVCCSSSTFLRDACSTPNGVPLLTTSGFLGFPVRESTGTYTANALKRMQAVFWDSLKYATTWIFLAILFSFHPGNLCQDI
jgi:hypothetical protein